MPRKDCMTLESNWIPQKSTQIQSMKWVTCVTPLLTCFPTFILELMQCCHLAEFILTSAAFYTLSFDLDNQVINEWNKRLHLTLEELYRLRLELFLQQPEICTFPKFLSVTEMFSTSVWKQCNQDTFSLKGGGGREDKNRDLQHRMGGEVFLPSTGLRKISFCLLPSLNLKSYYISLNNPTL